MPVTIGTPYRYSSHSWMRRDTWDTGEQESTWCAGQEDHSRVTLDAQDYHRECSHCWLHHTHTLDLHHVRLAQKISLDRVS